MDSSEASPEQAQEFNQIVQAWNEKLRLTGADSAELALGLLVRMGFLPGLGIVLLLFIFKVVNVILAFVLAVIIGLVLLGVSMLVSERARWNAMQQVYHSQVVVEIAQYARAQRLNRRQLNALAEPALPAGAPLAFFLSSAVDNQSGPIPEGENQEGG